MSANYNRYKQMERMLTAALILDLIVFILFMISAGNGIIWLKVLTILGVLAISGGCLYLLYINQELMKQRSFWITVGAAAILVCLIFSLILNFPSPRPV